MSKLKTLTALFMALSLSGGVANAGILDEIRNRIAMKEYAGQYRETGFPNSETIIFTLDADGGCWGQFVITNLNPIEPDFGPSIGDSGCTWKVVDVDSSGVKFELAFIEYLRDPLGLINLDPDADPVCSPACYAAGMKTGRIDKSDFRMRYNEYFFTTDLDYNVVPTALTPDGVVEREADEGFLDVTRVTADELKSTLEGLGATLEFPLPAE